MVQQEEESLSFESSSVESVSEGEKTKLNKKETSITVASETEKLTPQI